MHQNPARRGSHFADRPAAEQALALTLPMIEAAMADPQVSGCGFLYLVVMDPALTPADAPFEDAVLLEHAVGDRSRWDADYAAFARAKARVAWNHGDSHAVQALQPHRLRQGDSLLWGSAVLEGIVVAASGAFPWFDEAFATALAANLRAIAKQRHAAALEKRQLVAGG
jgi:hypothetical protein